METITIELDWSQDGYRRGYDTLNQLVQRHNITYEVISEDGPSGWPLIRITGQRENVTNFFVQDYINRGCSIDLFIV